MHPIACIGGSVLWVSDASDSMHVGAPSFRAEQHVELNCLAACIFASNQIVISVLSTDRLAPRDDLHACNIGVGPMVVPLLLPEIAWQNKKDTELESQQHRLSALDDVIVDSESKIKTLQDQLKLKEIARLTLQQQLNRSRQTLRVRNSPVKGGPTPTRPTVCHNCSSLQDQVSELQGEVHAQLAQSDRCQGLEKTVAELHSALDSLAKEKEAELADSNIHSQCCDLSDLDATHKLLEESQRELKEVLVQWDATQVESASTQKVLEASREEVLHLQKLLEDSEAEVKELQGVVSQKKDQETELASLGAVNSKLEQHVLECKLQLNAANLEVQRQAHLAEEVEGLREANRKLEQETIDAHLQLKAANFEVQSLVDAATTEAHLAEEVEGLREANRKLEQEKIDVHMHLKAANLEVQELRDAACLQEKELQGAALLHLQLKAVNIEVQKLRDAACLQEKELAAAVSLKDKELRDVDCSQDGELQGAAPVQADAAHAAAQVQELEEALSLKARDLEEAVWSKQILEERLAEVKGMLDRGKSEGKEVRTELLALRSKTDADRLAHQVELEEAREKVVLLEGEVKALKAQGQDLEEAKEEVVRLEGEVKALKAQGLALEEAKEEVVRLEGEVEALKAQGLDSEEAKEEVVRLEGEVKALKAQGLALEEAREEVVRLEGEVKAVKAQGGDGEWEVVRLNGVVKALSAQAGDFEEAREEVVRLEGEVNSLKIQGRDVEGARKEVVRLEAASKEVNKEVVGLEGEVEALEAEGRDTEASKEVLRLQEASKEVARLESEVEALRSDRDQLLSQTEDQAAELASVRKMLAQAADEATVEGGTLDLMQSQLEYLGHQSDEVVVVMDESSEAVDGIYLVLQNLKRGSMEQQHSLTDALAAVEGMVDDSMGHLERVLLDAAKYQTQMRVIQSGEDLKHATKNTEEDDQVHDPNCVKLAVEDPKHATKYTKEDKEVPDPNGVKLAKWAQKARTELKAVSAERLGLQKIRDSLKAKVDSLESSLAERMAQNQEARDQKSELEASYGAVLAEMKTLKSSSGVEVAPLASASETGCTAGVASKADPEPTGRSREGAVSKGGGNTAEAELKAAIESVNSLCSNCMSERGSAGTTPVKPTLGTPEGVAEVPGGPKEVDTYVAEKKALAKERDALLEEVWDLNRLLGSTQPKVNT
eukprot:gene16687-22947_t